MYQVFQVLERSMPLNRFRSSFASNLTPSVWKIDMSVLTINVCVMSGNKCKTRHKYRDLAPKTDYIEARGCINPSRYMKHT